MIAAVYVVFAFVALLIGSVDSRTLTSDDVATIKAAITSTFELEASYGTYCNAKLTPCTMGDNIGALVRLAFHDAAGNGGANGCIDFTHTTANKGLEEVVSTLDDLYYSNGYDSLISKADLYVLAANTAIEFASTEPTSARRSLQAPPGGAPPAGGPGPTMAPTTFASTMDTPPYTLSLPFRYGRVDSYSCDDTGSLPGANFTWSEINGLFGGRIGMNVKEVVAIMGAHSLGRCQYDNSGFDGGWTAAQSSFSNSFYKAFGKGIFRNDNHSAVWIDLQESTVMLMADVELLFSSNSMGEGTCAQFNTLQATTFCPLQSQSSASFVAYANHIDQFYANYSTAWQKLTEYGFSDLVVDVDSSYAGTYPYLSGTPSPTAAPSAPPTIYPTATPTISMSPTVSPSAALTEVPSVLPTATPTELPTAIPSLAPTEQPTASPSNTPTLALESTFSPTVSSSTATPSATPTYLYSASVDVYQVVQGIDAATWDSDPSIAVSFQEAVAGTCGNGIEYMDVNVTAVVDIVATMSKVAARVLSDAVRVSYTLTVPLSSGSEITIATIAASLVAHVNDGTFNTLLVSFGQSNVLGSGGVTSDPDSVSFSVVPTQAVTLAPTAVPTSADGTSSVTSSHSSSHHGVSTTSIIIIVVVLGFAAILTCAFIISRGLSFWSSQPTEGGDAPGAENEF
jgi:hypothetical protein